MAFDGIFVIDSLTLKNYMVKTFDNYHIDLRSSRSIIQNMQKQFGDLSRLAFTSPESIKSNKQLYGIKENKFVPINGDIEAGLLMILGVDAEDPNHTIEDYEHQYSIYKSLESKIGRFSNPLNSPQKTAKSNLYNFVDSDLMPRQYSFSTWDDLSKLVDFEQHVVLKKISGANGDQVHLLNNETYDHVKTKLARDSLENYIAQEFVDISFEKRLLFYGDKLAGTRFIGNVLMPWEKRNEFGDPAKRQFISTYIPTDEEVKLGLEYHKTCGLDYSAVDFATTKNGKDYLLEINFIHPGMIHPFRIVPGIAYDMGPKFVDFIKNDLMK